MRMFRQWRRAVWLGVVLAMAGGAAVAENRDPLALARPAALDVGWQNHPSHGWVYIASVSPGNIWAWNEAMDWIWTAPGVYPWVYSSYRGEWLYYVLGSSGPRWFYASTDADWQAGFTAAVRAENFSSGTDCAEDDNVNVPLSGPVEAFVIRATHPGYPVDASDCAPDFSGCGPSDDPAYPFTPDTATLYDDGTTVVEAVRQDSWWLPAGMTASANSGPLHQNMHMLRIYRKIADTNSWPQFLVLYADGNLRLIPHPPLGLDSVCFGSSVVVGPAAHGARPFAQIASVRYDSARDELVLTYTAGGEATIAILGVDRVQAALRVFVRYNTVGIPFATFRSMYVSPTVADAARVTYPLSPDSAGSWGDSSIMQIPDVVRASRFHFFRETPSVHNNSAPDISIGAD